MNIEVEFEDYGATCLTMSDNGHGILPENYEQVALRHHTSKFKDMKDLEELTSFGFRGELCE